MLEIFLLAILLFLATVFLIIKAAASGDYGDAASATSVIFAALLGIGGFDWWRNKQLEQRRTEVAEEALSLLYEAFDVFEQVRSPHIEGEGKSRNIPDNESPDLTSKYTIAIVPHERLQSHTSYFIKICKLRPKLKVFFGPDSFEPMNVPLLIRREILWRASLLRDSANDSNFLDKDTKQECTNYLYWYYDRESLEQGYRDKVEQQLDKALKDMESIVKESIVKPVLFS